MTWRTVAKRLVPVLGALALAAALAGHPRLVGPLVALSEAVAALAVDKQSSSSSSTAIPEPPVLTE